MLNSRAAGGEPMMRHGHEKTDSGEIIEWYYVERADSWRDCLDYLSRSRDSASWWIWRGQRCEDWPLLASLYRIKRERSPSNERLEDIEREHLDRFKDSIRGRRGPNPARLRTRDQWALGRHHGLHTPLLDWTASPYVALYFAFREPSPPENQREDNWTEDRVIYQIDPDGVSYWTELFNSRLEDGKRELHLEFFRPDVHDNNNLIVQNGYFSCSSPPWMDIKSILLRAVTASHMTPLMTKVTVPDRDRDEVLADLDRMNINDLTLFPDIYGAAQYSNWKIPDK
jgi:hypothetical protein